MFCSQPLQTANFEASYAVRRSSKSSYMEQPENSSYWPPGSVIPSFSPSTQESGTAVAYPTPRCTPPDTPTRIQLQLQPPPVRQLPLTESDEITSMEDTLRKILKSTKQTEAALK